MRPWTLLDCRPLPQGSLFLTHLLNIPHKSSRSLGGPEGAWSFLLFPHFALHTAGHTLMDLRMSEPKCSRNHAIQPQPSHTLSSSISTTVSGSWCHMACLQSAISTTLSGSWCHMACVMCSCEGVTLSLSRSSQTKAFRAEGNL